MLPANVLAIRGSCMIVPAEECREFLVQCAQHQIGGYERVYVPVQNGEDHPEPGGLTPVSKTETWSLEGHRPIDPAKLLFYRPREQVLPGEFSPPKTILAGVKACDLRGIQVLDTALLDQDFTDPGYQQWRNTVTIISVDCTTTAPTCHCTLVDGQPYARSGFDLNLSLIGDKYVVAIGSNRGEELANLFRKHLSVEESTSVHHSQVEVHRTRMTEQVEGLNASYAPRTGYDGLLRYALENWKEESEECVGCGGCTNICPTCHCMILNDESENDTFRKVRGYDSCQLEGYARVAGGGTPRPQMTQRFRHRYLCKFLYMPENFNQLGCTGCGRCIDVCPGGIEFRKVTTKLASRPDTDESEPTSRTEEVF